MPDPDRIRWPDPEQIRLLMAALQRQIGGLVRDGKHTPPAFARLLADLRERRKWPLTDAASAITEETAVEMLAAHIISRPIFDAVFEKSDALRGNPLVGLIEDTLEAIAIDAFARQHGGQT